MSKKVVSITIYDVEDMTVVHDLLQGLNDTSNNFTMSVFDGDDEAVFDVEERDE